MAKDDESKSSVKEQGVEIEQIKKRLVMLDQRLDNIDSVVTAVVERVMQQPITFNVTCPKCGSNMEIAIIGIQKPNK